MRVVHYLNQFFGGGIDAGGGFIEDEERSVFQQRARDADALFFADAQFHAAFTDARIVALRQASDEFMAISGARSREKLFLGGVKFAVQNILAHSAVEKKCLLAHDADLFAQRSQRRAADVLPVNQDAPRRRFIKRRQQIDDRGFARAVCGEPSILLADEPTGNLDSKNGEAVMELLAELHKSGATICMVTHDARYASHAERTIHLFDGRVVEESLASTQH